MYKFTIVNVVTVVMKLTCMCAWIADVAKNKDTKKLMDVFSLYEEEQVLPKSNVLRYAANVLEKAGEPIPFRVPQVCFTPA